MRLKSEVETRTLLLLKQNGEEIQIDVPVDWKITFGPLAIRDSGSERSSGKMPMALRLYETEKQQRAVFTDIVSFRDMSIPMRVKKVRVQEKGGFIECDGVKKHTTFQAKTSEWVNADFAERESKFLPPPDEDIFELRKEEQVPKNEEE